MPEPNRTLRQTSAHTVCKRHVSPPAANVGFACPAKSRFRRGLGYHCIGVRAWTWSRFLVQVRARGEMISSQWRRQLWGTISFLIRFRENLTANYPSSPCVVCESSLHRCQHLTALSISTALCTKLLVIKPLLQLALKSAVSAPWPNFQLCSSSLQILATPLSAVIAFLYRTNQLSTMRPMRSVQTGPDPLRPTPIRFRSGFHPCQLSKKGFQTPLLTIQLILQCT